MAGNAAVELELLQKRFPEEGIEQCGQLRSDFFCARSSDGRSYEGRLFVMDRALLFVSTYSTQFDLFISHRDIQKAVAWHHSFLPSLSLSLPDNEEHFTNFHDLGRLVALLKTLSISHLVTSAPTPVPAIQRMVSVPTPASHDKPTVEANQVEPCPFFVRSGFCPRQRLCKLDHSVHLHNTPPQSTANLMGGLSKVSFGVGHSSKFLPVSPSKIGRFPMTLSTPKRFHPMNSSEETPVITTAGVDIDTIPMDRKVVATTTTVVAMDIPTASAGTERGVATESTSGRVPGYHRSVSSPVVGSRGDGDTKRGACRESELAEQSRTDPTSPSLDELREGQSGSGVKTAGEEDGSEGGGGDAVLRERTRIDAICNEMTSSETAVEGISPVSQPTAGSCFAVVSPDIPKVFNFCKKSPNKSGTEVCVEGEVCSGGEVERGEVERGEVFLFTASPSKSGGGVGEERREGVGEGEEEEEEDVVVKHKPLALVRSDESAREDEQGGRGRQNEEMAVLAQQLQLDSDNDSIHGDLDVETQRKILDSFLPQSNHQSGPSDSQTGPTSYQSGSSNISTGHHSSPVKRRPCIYFLSGFCRNGLSCSDYHGLDFDPSELEDLDADMVSEQEPAMLPKEVKVHTADHTHISSGDKIILSPEVLVACEQQRLAYPVAFKLTHPVSGHTVYCGVLQFTAPSSDGAYLPQWMMEHLEASDGDGVSFSHVDLPKGTFVRLQPVSSAWLGIPYDKRMAMMEFQLRNFQTLTEGTKVTLTYELNRYTLKVLECKPAKGISILDADITTDIVEPADLNRYHSIVEGQAEHTSLGETVHCTVSSGTYRHFVLLSLPGQPLPSSLCVEVKMMSGDPDIFLSQSCTAPSQCRYTWCGQEVGDCCIHLSTEDVEYDINKPLYAGVVSLCEDTEFTLSFSEKQLTLSSKGVGQSLRDTTHLPKTTPTSSSDDTDGLPLSPSPPPPGHERCSSCGSVMPSLRLVMHMRHCAHSTYICPLCKAVLPKTAEKKHKYIAHNLLVCACGMEYTQFALHHHQKTDCSKRMVQCPFKWCNLSFPMDQLMNHENLCGRKMVTCSLCQQEVSQLELEMHLEAFHAVDTRDLDWSKPLQREDLQARISKQQFPCGCGMGFDFQDDMEVHQLTDCPLRRQAEHSSHAGGGEVVG